MGLEREVILPPLLQQLVIGLNTQLIGMLEIMKPLPRQFSEL